MKKIHGTNMGNWLVLEKWMKPDLFESTKTEDETWLARKLPADEFARLIKEHRESYVNEDDFRYIAEAGLNTVRLPVPYFTFGDRPPFIGCVEYIDKAFDWAEKYGLQILLDLHTVPYSQNGYDNGGITGVCKWYKHPEEVEFALTVLERLAQRYGKRDGLYGIEVLNEPISWIVYLTAPSTGKAVDKEEAKGSGYVPLSFLKPFYTEAYKRIRTFMGKDKAVVFHDGFRLTSWNSFFRESGFENVVLDTHIYIFAMENFVPIAKPWVYKAFIDINRRQIARVQKDVPVIVGEWCICNKYADHMEKTIMDAEEYEREQRRKYREIAKLELDAWSDAAGWFYWNYQLLRDRTEPVDASWKESWDFARCFNHGWLTKEDFTK
ncbi:MAG: cellulase family glycosylhydrolase [Oscillospiraceae bacterium]|nr:cellulase family glycosylhydrolase [Oscillospiraceae bacterium]